MPARSCLDCGRLIARGSRCPACREQRRDTVARHQLPAAIKARDGYRCVRCGAPDRLTVHHLVPLAAGGTHAPSNLVTLCWRCHQEAHRTT